MQIDWKKVASSAGYRKLKHRLLIGERWHPSDKRYLKIFKWTIARATHYAYHTGTPIEDILLEWTSKCNMSNLSYYNNERFPLLTRTMCLKKLGIKGLRKNNKRWYSGIGLKGANMKAIQQVQKEQSTKVKKRWSTDRKAIYKLRGASERKCK